MKPCVEWEPKTGRVAGLVMTACLSIFLSIGCGAGDDGPPTVWVSGSVNFDGEPLPEGRITLTPADDENERSYAGRIENGSFEFESEPGPKVVEITATREIDPSQADLAPEELEQMDDDESTMLVEQYIPDQYNRESELEAEVTAEGDNTFNFDLESGS